MKAMIFAAGLGTRLKPLTDTIPKALVTVGGRPLLEHAISRLIEAGCTEIVVNIHHFPGQIRQFLKEKNNFGITIHLSDETEEILDTGGGLLKAAGFLAGDEPVILHNVDIISNLDLNLVLRYHLEKKALATLVVRTRETQRYLLFDKEMLLRGWMNKASGEIRPVNREGLSDAAPFAFSGMAIVDPQFPSLIRQTGKFSLIDSYLQLASRFRVIGYPDNSSLWMDVGRPEHLLIAGKTWAGINPVNNTL